MMQTSDTRIEKETPPEITISKLFEIGIDSCEKQHPEKATKVIRTLIDSLNFDYGEVSNSFLKLYESTLKLVQEENYSEAASILQALQQTWDEAVVLKNNTEGETT